MDETPEEMEQIRREASEIDVHHYRKRFRFLAAIALGGLMAGLVSLVLWMVDSKRNPCERVRDHFCKQNATSMQCKMYGDIFDESVHDESGQMRANIKAQCLSKIERLKEDDGVTVK